MLSIHSKKRQVRTLTPIKLTGVSRNEFAVKNIPAAFDGNDETWADGKFYGAGQGILCNFDEPIRLGRVRMVAHTYVAPDWSGCTATFGNQRLFIPKGDKQEAIWNGDVVASNIDVSEYARTLIYTIEAWELKIEEPVAKVITPTDPVVEPTPEPTVPTAEEVFPHLDASQAAIAQPLLEASQIQADDYLAQDAKWVEVTALMPDSSSRNSADQNAALTERWAILERDNTWTHPTAGYGTQARADEVKQSWVDYLSWVSGSPTYEYNGAVPGWGWSGYINNFQSWRGWILNFVPNKYGHLL